MRTTTATTLLIASLVALQGLAQETSRNFTALNAAEIVSGVLYGILEDEIPSNKLDACITDGESLERQVQTAVQDLESLTFDGVKRGLEEAGQAVKMIPGMVKDCSDIKNDISVLVKMASIFEHPLSLIYHIGKALIVNGSDIFAKISAAIEAYKAQRYFEFGTNLGEALDEVFIKILSDINSAYPLLKNANDEHAYECLVSFLGETNLDA